MEFITRISSGRAVSTLGIGCKGLVQVSCIMLLLATAAVAQSTVVNPASAPPQATGSWDPVTRLAPNTHLKISASKNGGSCILQSVDATGLICIHGSSTRSVQRADITSIKFARRGRSALIGLGLGAAVGAGAGAGIGAGINSADKGSFVHVSGGKSVAVGAGVGVILGGGVAALIGYSTDAFAGPVIYKR